MPEIEITAMVNTEKLIRLMKENDHILLKCKDYTLIATKSDKRPCAGSSTFSEFKWGTDKGLRAYLKKGNFSQPWVIRIQRQKADYDWVWMGGETMELGSSGIGGSIANCYIVGIAEK